MDLNINLLLLHVIENCYKNEEPCECNKKEHTDIEENLCNKCSSLNHIRKDGDEENCRQGSYYCCYENVFCFSEPVITLSTNERKYRNTQCISQSAYQNLTIHAGKWSAT